VILVPTVISELDNLKVQARSSEMRDKVKKVITQIKEMRRRGHLTNGVKVNSKMSLRTIAVEPSQGTALSWLDFENLDDRIVASVMEVTRENLDQVVILVTADLNLQTKAEFARIPYLEPPDPT
jgi:predicted ribonuclease YlaK